MGDKGVEHRPTELTKAKVEAFTCAGFDQERIAAYLDISVPTLTKYYKDELIKSKMEKTSALEKNLYKDALEGNSQSREFWLKCQGGWSYCKNDAEAKKDEKQLSLMELLINKI